MQLYIPDNGEELTLAKDWTFNLYGEGRNEDFWCLLENKKSRKYSYRFEEENAIYEYQDHCVYNNEVHKIKVRIGFAYKEVTLPKGTILKVDRHYIRNGNKEFSSLTFRIKSCPIKTYEKQRFWAKLLDVNQMEIEDDTNKF